MPNSLNPNSLTAPYQQLAQLSNQIIESIRQQQWAAATELCHVYSDVLELLKNLPRLTCEQRKKRRLLLSTILSNDAQIQAYLYQYNQAINYIYHAKTNNSCPTQLGPH